MGILCVNAVLQHFGSSIGWDIAAGRQHVQGLLKQIVRPEKQHCYVQSHYNIPLITSCKGSPIN